MLFGNGGLELEEAGEITYDRFGLTTATCTFTAPKDKIIGLADAALITGTTPHPYAPYLLLDKKKIVLSPGISKVTCEYAGVNGTSEFIYEFEAGVKEEPIQSHPNYPILSKRYGILYDPKSGETERSQPWWPWRNYAEWEFVRFRAHSEMAGVESFLDFSNGVWKATRVTNTRPASPLGAIGTISAPPGNPPTITDGGTIHKLYVPEKSYDVVWVGRNTNYYYDFEKTKLQKTVGGTRDWLYMGFDYSQRGGAFTESHRWLLSGIGGWNPLVYRDTDFDEDEFIETQ
jgi:hypothetical protein